MAKKGSALGSTPTFNLGGSVANINGISISPQTEAEAKINKEEIEKLEEAQDAVKTIIKQVEETTKKRTLNKPNKDAIKEIERLKNKVENNETNEFNNLKEKVEKKQEELKEKPILKSNKMHLKKGYTRQTFAVKDEHLQLIRALASYKNIEQKQLLEMLLNKAFSEIDDQIKENALHYFNKDASEQEIDLF